MVDQRYATLRDSERLEKRDAQLIKLLKINAHFKALPRGLLKRLTLKVFCWLQKEFAT